MSPAVLPPQYGGGALRNGQNAMLAATESPLPLGAGPLSAPHQLFVKSVDRTVGFEAVRVLTPAPLPLTQFSLELNVAPFLPAVAPFENSGVWLFEAGL